MITAAYALIRDEAGRLLIVANDYSESGDGICWGLPGGGMEEGETLEACAVRECMEEVGIGVALGRYVGVVERKLPDFHIQAHHFEANIVTGSPRVIPNEEHVVDFAWVSHDDLIAKKGRVLGRRGLLAYLLTPDMSFDMFRLLPGEE